MIKSFPSKEEVFNFLCSTWIKALRLSIHISNALYADSDNFTILNFHNSHTP